MSKPDTSCIVVVCAADDKYAMPLTATMRSALDNLTPDRNIILFIIDGGIQPRRKKQILHSLNSTQCEIRWVQNPNSSITRDQDSKDFVSKMGSLNPHVTLAAYYRLLIPELLPPEFDKAIYLDSDLIVLGNLGDLWDIEIGENYLLAVQDMLTPYVSCPSGLLNYKELGLLPESRYLQSGVLVLNLQKWRSKNVTAAMMEYLQNNKQYIRWDDSDILNAVLANKWETIDPRWNQLPFVHDSRSWENCPFPQEFQHNLIHHPYIIHYSTALKPWNSSAHPATHLFYKYLDRTSWAGWRNTIWRRAWRRLTREAQRVISQTASQLKRQTS
jgi:lipopolysaccharide biosynthesis glycosyltransferase